MRPIAGVGRQPHGAEERTVDRHDHAFRHLRGLGFAVERNDPRPDPGEFLRQGSGISPLAIVAPIEGEIDIEDAHFEHVARHGALNLNRAGQDMRAGAAVFHLAVDVAVVLRHSAGRNHAGLVDHRWDDGGDALQRDDIAGLDAEHRLDAGEKVTDVHGLRARHERVFGGAHRADIRGRDVKQRAGDNTGGVQLAMTAERSGKHDEVPMIQTAVMLKRYGGRETK